MAKIKYKNPETNQFVELNVDDADWEHFKKSRYAVGSHELKNLKKQKIEPKAFEKAEWVISADAFLSFGGAIYLGLAFFMAALFLVNPLVGVAFMAGSLLLGGVLGGLWAYGSYTLAQEDNAKLANGLNALGTQQTYFEYLESDELIAQLTELANKGREELVAINASLPDTSMIKGVILKLADPTLNVPDRIQAVQKRLANQYIAPLYVKAQSARAPSDLAPAMRYGMLAVGTLGIATMLGGIALGIATVFFAAPILTAALTASVVTAVALIVGAPFALGITALRNKLESLKAARARAIDQFSQQKTTKLQLVDHIREAQQVSQSAVFNQSALQQKDQELQVAKQKVQEIQQEKDELNQEYKQKVEDMQQEKNGLKQELVQKMEEFVQEKDELSKKFEEKAQKIQGENDNLSQELMQAEETIKKLQKQLLVYQTNQKELKQLAKEKNEVESPKKELPVKAKGQTSFFDHKGEENVMKSHKKAETEVLKIENSTQVPEYH